MKKQKTYSREATDELFEAIKNMYFKGVKKSIEKNAKINAVYYGNSPLRLSFLYTNFKIIRYLIDNGADISFPYKKESSTLLEILVELLVRSKPDKSKISMSRAKTKDWLSLYKTQKKIIDAFPIALIILNKYNFLHHILKEEKKHLITANELNLL